MRSAMISSWIKIRKLLLLSAVCLLAPGLFAQTPSKTTLVDNVYYGADASTSTGYVLISPVCEFTTTDGYTLAPYQTVKIPLSGGAVNTQLIPNTGTCVFSSTQSYYQASINVSSKVGSTNWTEYWRIPATGSTSLSAARLASAPPIYTTFPFSQLTPPAGCAANQFPQWTGTGWGCAAGGGLADPGANGIVKRTALNTTGIATYADIVGLFSGCSGTQYLGFDGNCHTPSSGVTFQVNGTGLSNQATINFVNNGAISFTNPSLGQVQPVCAVAGSGQAGCLASSDWTAFNNKQPALSSYTIIASLWASGSCSGYLKSDGTCNLPSAVANLSGGAIGSAPYQSAASTTGFLASPTTSGHTFLFAWQPAGSAVAPIALDASGLNAGTATAAAAAGTECTPGNYPLGVDANWNAKDCTAAATGSGTVTHATIAGTANQITVTGVGSCDSTTVLNCQASLPNVLIFPGTITLGPGASTVPTGASLAPIGTGTIVATSTTGNAATATKVNNSIQPITNVTDTAWGVSMANTAAQNQTAFASVAAAVNAGTTPAYVYLPEGTYNVLTTGSSLTTNNGLGYYTVPVTFHCQNPATTIINQSGVGKLIEFGPAGMVVYPTGGYSNQIKPNNFENCQVTGGSSTTSLTLTAAANASAGATQYTGTITGGGSNAFVGYYFTVAGDGVNYANNGGPWICTASSTTTITLANANGVSHSFTGTAVYGADGIVADPEVYEVIVRDNQFINYGNIYNWAIHGIYDNWIRALDNHMQSNDGTANHGLFLYEGFTTPYSVVDVTNNQDNCYQGVGNIFSVACAGPGIWVPSSSFVNIERFTESGPGPAIRFSLPPIAAIGGPDIHDSNFENYTTSTTTIEYGVPGLTTAVSSANIHDNGVWLSGSDNFIGPAGGATSGTGNTITLSRVVGNVLRSTSGGSSVLLALNNTAGQANSLSGNTGFATVQTSGSNLPSLDNVLTQLDNYKIGLTGYMGSPLTNYNIFSTGMYYDNASGTWIAKATTAASLIVNQALTEFTADSGLTSGNAFTPTTKLNLYASGGICNAAACTDPGANIFKWTGTMNLGAANTSGPNLTSGSFRIQPYALNNADLLENTYFDGTKWVYGSTGYASLISMFSGEIQMDSIASGTGAATLTPKVQFRINNSGAFALGGNMANQVTGQANWTEANIIGDSSGHIGILTLGSSTSATACYDTSSITSPATYNTLAACTSLRKYKTNIKPLSASILELMKLQPVSYKSKTNGRDEIGFIAEDVEKVDPKLATYNAKGELQGVMYDHMVSILTKAVQEQQSEIEQLKRDIDALKAGR